MARKDTLNYTPPEFDNVSVASTVNNFSNPTNVNLMDNIGIILNWSGAPVGTFEIYASNNKMTPKVVGDYTKLDFVSPITIDNTNSHHLISINQLPYVWIALRYASTSGSGNMTAIINNKQVGG